MRENSTLNFRSFIEDEERLAEFINSDEFSAPSVKSIERIIAYSKAIEIAKIPKMTVQIILN